jgi:hypothetical protein
MRDLQQEFEDWVDGRILHLIKIHEFGGKDVGEYRILRMIGTCASSENEMFNELWYRLTLVSRRMSMEWSLQRLKDDYTIECSRVERGSAQDILLRGRLHERFYRTLSVLDAIAKATTPPVLLSLDPGRCGW